MKQEFAEVKVLLSGYFKWQNPYKTKFAASSTATLIQDGKYNILVDTGNLEMQDELVKALKNCSLKTSQIDCLILTHDHQDHTANRQLFKNSLIIEGNVSYQNGQYKLNLDYLLKKRKRISPNVQILSTPGHTRSDCSVLAHSDLGEIAVAGDLFVKNQAGKSIYVEDKKRLIQNQNKIIKLADYIIPGHGRMFKVLK